MTPGDSHSDFPLNWDDVFSRIGDEDIIVEFAGSFIRNGQKLLDSLAEAVTTGDPEQIELYAHALKGSASNMGAIPLAKAAWLLEKAGADKQVEQAGPMFETIGLIYETLHTLLGQADWLQQAKDAVAVKAS